MKALAFIFLVGSFVSYGTAAEKVTQPPKELVQGVKKFTTKALAEAALLFTLGVPVTGALALKDAVKNNNKITKLVSGFSKRPQVVNSAVGFALLYSASKCVQSVIGTSYGQSVAVVGAGILYSVGGYTLYALTRDVKKRLK